MIAKREMLLFGALMIATALVAHAMKPTKYLSGGPASANLAAIVPSRFGDWQIDTTGGSVTLPSELEEQQKEIYDQVLVRTYRDQSGDRIMLTIAYGGNQSRLLQVHRPEVCYVAQGFQLLHQQKVMLPEIAGASAIPAMQLVAVHDERSEPVTYWIRIGDQVVRGNIELGIARVSYGLRGYIPDGLLFRVSNITRRSEEGFEVQKRFIRDLLSATSTENRHFLVGSLALQDH